MNFDPSILDFRSSRFHELCGANGELTETGKKWVDELWREWQRSTYIRGFIGNKTTEKGHIVEQSAIDRMARVFGWGPTIKSSKEFRDHIGTGHPDVWKPAIGARADAKSSWWDDTFPLTHTKLKNKAYDIQAKRYCMQAGVSDWWVVYCLENTPEKLVVDEAQRLWKESGEIGFIMKRGEFVSPKAEQFYDQVKTLHTFDHLADWERVKPFKVELTNADVVYFNQIHDKAKEHALTLHENYQKHKEFIESLKLA